MNGIPTLESTTNAWFEAQRKLIEQWGSIWTPGLGNAMDQHQGEQANQQAHQGSDTLPGMTEPVAKMVSEQMMNGQAAMAKLIEMTSEAWQSMTPQMIGGDWQAALQQYTDQLRTTLAAAPQQTLEAAQSTSQLWQTWLDQSQQFGMPWLNAAQQSLGPWTQAAGGDVLALNKVNALYWDAYHQTFGRLINTPAFGANREVNERQVAVFNGWVETIKASSEFQIVTTNIWTRAFQRYIETLVQRTQAGETVSNARELVNLWTDVAEEVFEHEFRSPAYVEAQGKLLNSSMEFQLRTRDLSERALRGWGLPTKTDVDSAHKGLYDLRKEVKALKKAQQTEQEQPDAEQQAVREQVQQAHEQVQHTSEQMQHTNEQIVALQESVKELQAAQPDTQELLDGVNDLRKQLKRLRKSIKEQDAGTEADEPKKRERAKKEPDA